MLVATLLHKLLDLPGLRVRNFEFQRTSLVIDVVPRKRLLVCGECGRSVRGSHSVTERTWRHLAIGGVKTIIRSPIRRLRCPACKAVKTELLPWARHGSRFTRPFEDAVGFLAQRLDKTSVAEIFGIAWVTVGAVAERLVAEKLPESRLDGLKRIGVDEIGYRKNHKYLTVVVDHVDGDVVWAGEGRNAETLSAFFAELGPERAKDLELVSIDMSAAYEKAVADAAPGAKIVYDRFHLAKMAGEAVDELRRESMRQLAGEDKRALKKTRWILRKNPGNLSDQEVDRLAELQKTNAPLYRGYLLKDVFNSIFLESCPKRAKRRFHAWISWAGRSRLKPFVRMARTVRRRLDGIVEYIRSGLTNAILEGMNNKIRLLSHRAFGFHSAKPLIATIYLCCSGIDLPQLHLI